MTAPTTRTLYAKLATDRPVKARRYRASILDTLAREGIGDLERARLTEALAGIGDVLGGEVTCRRCGAVLEAPESIERRLGSHCAERLALAS